MNTRRAHSAHAITMNSKWTYNNSILQIKYYPVKSYYQEKRHIILFMVTSGWASILSLLLKPESCIFPSATHRTNKNIPSISLGRFMPLQWCLQCRSNSYVGEISSPLMPMSKLPQMITEPGVPLCLLQLFLRTWRSPEPCTLGSPHHEQWCFSRTCFTQGTIFFSSLSWRHWTSVSLRHFPICLSENPICLALLSVSSGTVSLELSKKNTSAWGFTGILRRYTSACVFYTAQSCYRITHIKATKGRRPS